MRDCDPVSSITHWASSRIETSSRLPMFTTWPAASSCSIKAAKAEGVPISEERYARIGDAKRPLHRSPIFGALDVSSLGGNLAATRDGREPPHLPVTEGLDGRLLKLPPFTKVPERYVRECAQALRKVAECAATMGRRSGRHGTRPEGAGIAVEEETKWTAQTS